MLDVYRKTPIKTQSAEHILPEFLGGRWRSSHLIDEITNREFGHSIDAALAQALHWIRVSIDARSKATKPTPTLQNVKGFDGQIYDIEAGGKIRIKPSITKFEYINGNLHIEGHVADKGQLRQMLKKKARQMGWDIDSLVDEIMEESRIERRSSPRMHFPTSLWTSEPYRATAKIACNLFALHDRDLFLQKEFDSIRRYVVSGTSGSSLPLVQVVDVDLRGDGRLGQLDHLVKVEAGADGQVIGMVVYFATLAFVIHLGECFKAKPFTRTYRVDQLGNIHRKNDNTDIALQIPSHDEAATRSHEEFVALVQKQCNRLGPEVAEINTELWVRRIVRPHLDRLLEQGDGSTKLTREAIAEFSRSVAHTFMQELAPRMEEAARRRREKIAEENDSE